MLSRLSAGQGSNHTRTFVDVDETVFVHSLPPTVALPASETHVICLGMLLPL